MEMHEDIPKYKCEICKKKFTVKRHMEVHRSSYHKKGLYGVDESYRCQVCGKPFWLLQIMVRHLTSVHKIGVLCKICEEVFNNKHDLKMHMHVHTGQKRYCCDACGKVFAKKKYLTKHQEVHERENSMENVE